MSFHQVCRDFQVVRVYTRHRLRSEGTVCEVELVVRQDIIYGNHTADSDPITATYPDTGSDTDADTGPDADTDARTISQIDSEHDIRVSGLDDTGDGTGLSEVRVCHGDDDGRGRPDDVELYICGRKWQL